MRWRRTAAVLDEAADLGAPVPRHELVVEVADQVVVVQPRLPGCPLDPVGIETVETLIATDDGFTGLLAGRPDVPTPVFHLTSSGAVHLPDAPGLSATEAFTQLSTESQDDDREVRDIAAEVVDQAMRLF